MIERDSSTEAAGSANPDRPPSVPLRDQHGAVTKRVILRAARARFAANGYAGTSVKEIADEAGVAVQTLYSAFGSKGGVVLGLADLIDEEAGVHPLFREIVSVADPREALPLFARIRRQIREHCGDIVSMMRAGAKVDADVEAAWADGLRRRHAGISRVVERLAQSGALKDGIDAAHAADVIAAVVADEVCDVLVDQRGWSFDDYESWLADTLPSLTLDPAAPRAKSTPERRSG